MDFRAIALVLEDVAASMNRGEPRIALELLKEANGNTDVYHLGGEKLMNALKIKGAKRTAINNAPKKSMPPPKAEELMSLFLKKKK